MHQPNVKTVYQQQLPIIPLRSARRVLLLIDTAGSYGRGLIQGISKYNREHGNWYTRLQPAFDSPRRTSRDVHVDGVLIGAECPGGSDAMTALVRQMCGAVVNFHPAYAQVSGIPYFGVDEKQIAALAAQHLIDRGVEHLAFCGPRRTFNPSLMLRGERFAEFAEFANRVTDPTARGAAGADGYCAFYAGEADSGEAAQARLAQWIADLPKPLGILTANDRWGLRVLDACRIANAKVPEEVAVVGVDNDEALCELAQPPLSSIDVNAEGVGYEGAAMLDRLMSAGHGEDLPAGTAAAEVCMAPRGVVTRRSSDFVASEDEDVSRAVKFIRERACGPMGLQVEDVLGYTGASRASLQQRMKKLLGHTIHQEIQRVRLDRAKELLAMSGMTIKQVARESGFASVQYMTRVFRAGTGETPARYRSRRSLQCIG